MQTKRKKEKQT